MGIKGGLNFGTGLLLGNQGFWNIKNGFIQRTYLKGTLMTPADMIIEEIINSVWQNLVVTIKWNIGLNH